MLTFATKTLSTGANGQKADAASPFVRAFCSNCHGHSELPPRQLRLPLGAAATGSLSGPGASEGLVTRDRRQLERGPAPAPDTEPERQGGRDLPAAGPRQAASVAVARLSVR